MRHENIMGAGDVYAGVDRLGRVTFHLRVTTAEDDADPPGDGVATMEGLDGFSLESLVGREGLILHLRDGRRWPFALLSPGDALGHGDLAQA
jgi:hypothetical protein